MASNNGMIVMGVREAAYEYGGAAIDRPKRAMRELDDADLVRPTAIGAWRGRHATEWRLTWHRCDKTGQFARNNWITRTPYHQLLLPKPAAKAPLPQLPREPQTL